MLSRYYCDVCDADLELDLDQFLLARLIKMSWIQILEQ